MRLVDLTHPLSIHTPGWVGYPSLKLYYFQRHATNGIVSQMLELPLHSGTHFDGEMHIVSGGKDVSQVPLDKLCREGVIVDLSEEMDDFTVITPEHITSKVEVKEGDILLYYTGWNRFYNGAPEEDEQRYFLRHPGGDRRLAQWFVDMKLAWTGSDTGSADHPMNTSIRYKRPDVARRYTKLTGRDPEEEYPEEGLFCMHHIPFPHGITHVENLGGDISEVRNRRVTIGAFPMPLVGGEAFPCRVVAFLDD